MLSSAWLYSIWC